MHPPLTAVTLTALVVTFVAAIVGLTPADGDTTELVWLVAITAAVIAAVPTAVTGLLDLRALREGTRAVRSVTTHAGTMVGAVAALLIVAVRGHMERDGNIDAFDGAGSIIVIAVAFAGAAIGASAMHRRGAGIREETLTDEARGGRRVATTGGNR